MRLYLVRHAEAAPGERDELRVRCGGARETGEALADATGAEAQSDERLAPGATADDVRAAIAGRGETVVVVGHQPDCGRIAAALTGGEEPRFPAAGCVSLDL